MSLSCYRNRQEIARQLHGHGVEFGPGCHPLALHPYVRSIRYCDIHDRAGFSAAFPEVDAVTVARFPEPIDFRIDFDKQPFVPAIGEGSLDFVIANHVLEHLVNPLRFLIEARRLLRADGLLFVALPDPRCTFDRDRQRTPLRDVLDRYVRAETELSEERIVAWCREVDKLMDLRPESPGYRALLDGHRRRSIHVNVWLIDDLIEMLRHLAIDGDAPLHLLDGMIGNGEYIVVLRRAERAAVVEHYQVAMQRILAESQSAHLEAQLLPRLEQQRQLMAELVKGQVALQRLS